MKNTLHVSFACKIMLVCLAFGGAGRSLLAQSELRFRLVNSLIVISVKSNQAGPFDFVLDTGADTTVVDPSIASRLSFVPLDHVRQTTLSGMQTVTRGAISGLSAGSARVDHVQVLIQDLSELRRIDARIEGIAGQDFLSHFNYLLDYHRRLIRIEHSSEIENAIDGDHVSIDRRENRMLVRSEVQAEEIASLKLLVDSGANCLVLLPLAVQALDLKKSESGLELTSNGRAELQTSRVRALTVGSQKLHDLAAALPAIEPAERIGDGLLPTALFAALYVNNRESFIVFNPRIKGDSHFH
jgi:predicted aspartyl protease